MEFALRMNLFIPIIFLSIFLFTLAFTSEAKVELVDYLAYAGGTGIEWGQIYVDKDNEGTTEDDIIRMYYPIYKMGGTQDQRAKSIFNDCHKLTGECMPKVAAVETSFFDDAPSFKFSITHDSGGLKDICLAAKDDDGVYYLKDIDYGATWPDSGVETDIELTLENLCGDSGAESVCDMNNIGENKTSVVVQKLYIFYNEDSTACSAAGLSVTISEDNGNDEGLYIELQMSAYTGGDTTTNSFSITKFDEQLKITFDATSLSTFYDMEDLGYKVLLTKGVSALTAISDIRDAMVVGAGFLSSTEYVLVDPNFGEALGADVMMPDLDNGTIYHVTVGLVNKFQFVSKLAVSQAGTPEKILEVLKNQHCYLLTAGFKREHYVLNFFKKFRDTVLLKYSLGRKFIRWYYDSSPYVAMYIYYNDTLSFLVRTAAYVLYFIIKHSIISLSLLLGLGCLVTFRKKIFSFKRISKA